MYEKQFFNVENFYIYKLINDLPITTGFYDENCLFSKTATNNVYNIIAIHK